MIKITAQALADDSVETYTHKEYKEATRIFKSKVIMIGLNDEDLANYEFATNDMNWPQAPFRGNRVRQLFLIGDWAEMFMVNFSDWMLEN